MRTIYQDEFQVSPLFVVVDGHRAKEMLYKQAPSLSDGRMIPLHQMHEAEVIVISKTDLLTKPERMEIVSQIGSEVPDAQVVEFSSTDGRNVSSILEIINSDRETAKAAPQVDQRAFMTEKAMMGWYSADCSLLASAGKVDTYDLLMGMMKGIAARFQTQDIAHVKIFLDSPAASAKISLVEDSIQVDVLKGGRHFVGEAKLVLNSRVRSQPEPLRAAIESVMDDCFAKAGLRLLERKSACFVPKADTPKFISM